jgi:hypothetical protein
MSGVYYAAAELSSKGYVVTLTARNAPAVDMLVSTADLRHVFNVQVKANKPKEAGGTQAYWLLSKEAKSLVSPNLIYVFVNLKQNGKPDFYVAKSSTVAKRTVVERRKNSTWYSFNRDESYKDRWDLFR